MEEELQEQELEQEQKKDLEVLGRKVYELQEKIKAEGIALEGVTADKGLIFGENVTKEQASRAFEIAAAFDMDAPPDYTPQEKRAVEYVAEMPQGDIYDAFIKIGLNIKEYAVKGITPDASQPKGTPEWLLGTALAIKERHPKEELKSER